MVWKLVARAKFLVITLLLGDIKCASLNAVMKDGEVVIAQPPPEWQPTKLKASFQRVVRKLCNASYGLWTSPKRWQDYSGEILKEMGFESHPHDACVFIKKVGHSVVMLCDATSTIFWLQDDETT